MKIEKRNLNIRSLSDISVTFIAGMLGLGGAERQLYYFLKVLSQHGCETNLLTLTKDQHYENVIRDLGIPVDFVGGSENRFERLNSVFNLIKDINPTIIQSQHFYANLYAALPGRLLGIPHIGAIRSNGAHEVMDTGRVLGKLSLYLPKYLAANSFPGMDYAISQGVHERRLRYLPNVVDTEMFCPRKKSQTSGKVTILSIGNLTLPDKRMDLIIQAANSLKHMTNIPFQVKIVGEGSMLPGLRGQAEAYGLYPGVVDFLDKQAHIEDLYCASDIFVLSSDREGTPNVIMEAMSCGLPVIATNVGGISKLVQDGKTGFLIETGSSAAIAEKLVTMLSDMELRLKMGNAGRAFIEENHSIARLDSILLNLYQSIL